MEKVAVILFLVFALCESRAETVLKEFRSSLGVARLLLPPQASGEPVDSAESLSGEKDTSVASTIGDLGLPGGTLLLVYFQDAYSGEEIRFPVRVSQIRRFLRSQTKTSRSGSREDHIVAGIRDLSRNLKVRMRTGPETEESK